MTNKYKLVPNLRVDSQRHIDLSMPSPDSIFDIRPSSGSENCFLIYAGEDMLCKIGVSQTAHSYELWFNGDAWDFATSLQQSALQLCLDWIFLNTSEPDVWIMAKEKEVESRILQFGFQKLDGCRPSEQWYVISKETWRIKMGNSSEN